MLRYGNEKKDNGTAHSFGGFRLSKVARQSSYKEKTHRGYYQRVFTQGSSMKEKQKALLIKKMIKVIKEDFGTCREYSELCMGCEATQAVKFLKRFLKVLE